MTTFPVVYFIVRVIATVRNWTYVKAYKLLQVETVLIGYTNLYRWQSRWLIRLVLVKHVASTSVLLMPTITISSRRSIEKPQPNRINV